MGLEPEGTWQSAGGALQPEAAFAAAKVESLQAHQNTVVPKAGTAVFFWQPSSREALAQPAKMKYTLTICQEGDMIWNYKTF